MVGMRIVRCQILHPIPKGLSLLESAWNWILISNLAECNYLPATSDIGVKVGYKLNDKAALYRPELQSRLWIGLG